MSLQRWIIASGKNEKVSRDWVQTLHRHLAYHYYPVESLGGVYEVYKGEILGAPLFRAVIRWGELAEVGEMPDPQFPVATISFI